MRSGNESNENPTGGKGKGAGRPGSEFSRGAAVAVGIAINRADAARCTLNGDRTPEQPVQQPRQQQSSQGAGSGNSIPIQPAMSFSGDQFLQFIDAIKSNNVYQPMADRYHDGKKVNVRGGIDRILTDPIPKDLQGRSIWIKSEEVALSTNGSGVYK